MVEGARLESVYTGNRIAGSNPAPSAKDFTKSPWLQGLKGGSDALALNLPHNLCRLGCGSKPFCA